MTPKKLGWILLATPLIVWLAWAAPAWFGVRQAEREHQQLLRIYELETQLKSPRVHIATDGDRYHRESHLPEKTRAVSRFEAQELGYTPCLTCKPPGLRRYPSKPEPDPAIAERRQTIRWSTGLVPLCWAVLWLLPIPIREYYMKWRE